MSSSRRTRTYVLLGAAAALAGLVVISYVALPVVLAGWLQRLLTEQGFTDVRLEFGYPGLHMLRIHRLELAGTRAGQAFTLSARNLAIEYGVAELAAGRVIRLRIPEAVLRSAPALPAEDVTTPQPTALPLPATWVAAFPVQELVVDKLQVDWRMNDAETLTGYVRGWARRVGTQLQSRWSLADKQRPVLDLAFDAMADGTLAATVFRPDAPSQPVLRATTAVTPRDEHTVAFRGSLEAQFKPLAAMLSPWLTLPKTFSPIDGQLLARWSGDAPAVLPAQTGNQAHDATLNGTLSVDLSAVRLGTRLQDGSLHLDAALSARGDSIRSIRWRVDKSFRFSAYVNPAIFALTGGADRNKFVRTAEPLVVRAPRGLSGEVARAPLESRLTLAPKAVLVLEQLHTPDAHDAKLTATLLNDARITYQPASRLWKTGGLAVAVATPALQPQFASIGSAEDLALTARLGAGPLTRLPPLTVDDAAMTLLGGRLRGRDIHYDSARDINRFTIDIEHLDLARVVALEQQQQIVATGTLDGRLPFTLTRHGIGIDGGQMRAMPPGGVIRYQPNETIRTMAEGNPNLKLVVQALSNYHYEKLDIGVNYAENGDLALQIAMAGRNPDWNAGQPVNLNIHLSENVLMLLRSLRLADDISGEVEKRVREQSEPKR
jgi:hypothetical protein